MRDSKKPVLIVGVGPHTMAQRVATILEEIKDKVDVVIVEADKEPEPMTAGYRWDEVEYKKLNDEIRYRKPHRGKHRTPQNKYR